MSLQPTSFNHKQDVALSFTFGVAKLQSLTDSMLFTAVIHIHWLGQFHGPEHFPVRKCF